MFNAQFAKLRNGRRKKDPIYGRPKVACINKYDTAAQILANAKQKCTQYHANVQKRMIVLMRKIISTIRVLAEAELQNMFIL